MNLTIHAPQIIYFVILALGLIFSAIRHGSVNKITQNEHPFITAVVGGTIVVGLLLWGGAFTSFGIWQIILIIKIILDIIIETIKDRSKTETTNFFKDLQGSLIYFPLLYLTGFFGGI